MTRLLVVCATCRPGFMLAGFQVSHGICRLHELETYAADGMLKWWEVPELWVRRSPYTYAAIGLFALVVALL